MMKRFLLFSTIFLSAWVAFGEGPVFQHKDKFVNQEFQNAYQDIRNKVPIYSTSSFVSTNSISGYASLAGTQTLTGSNTFYNSVYITSGSATYPGISFIQGPKDGFYRSSPNEMSYAINGVQSGALSATQFTGYGKSANNTVSFVGATPSINVQNSKTITLTMGSGKVFIVSGGSGNGVLVVTDYITDTITILGTSASIVASATPSASQIGISKSANSHNVLIKSGSSASGTNGSITIIGLSGGITLTDWQ